MTRLAFAELQGLSNPVLVNLDQVTIVEALEEDGQVRIHLASGHYVEARTSLADLRIAIGSIGTGQPAAAQAAPLTFAEGAGPDLVIGDG